MAYEHDFWPFSIPKAGGILILFILPLVFLLAISGFALARKDPQLTTRIYDRNGHILYEIFGEKHRIWVPLDKIPKYLQLATIASEDKRFYFHKGVDPAATLRAAKSTIFDRQIQGGSTITQQYVRNAFLSPEKTIVRKIKEIFLASLIEQFSSKEKILEKYLNEVPYGGINWGVGAASRYYFAKDVKDLSLSESAFLASLPKAPSTFSPQRGGEELANSRKNQVLRLMHQLGMISYEEKEKAKEEKLKFTFTPTAFLAPHFVLDVKEELIKKFGKEKVEGGGLEVRTTLDLSIQEMAEGVVRDEVKKLKGLKVGNGIALVADPKTGGLLALVGSADYFNKDHGNFNVVTSALRQPGSAIKPVMYAQAFEAGYTPATILFDIPTVFYNKWEKYAPINYDRKFHGPLPLRFALGNSYNVPAIRMLATIGVENFIEKAKEMGIGTLEKNGLGLSLTVGGGGVRPIELAQSYQVLANLGVKKDLFSILDVKDRKGNILFKHQENEEQVVRKEIAFLLSDILSDNDARMWAFGLRSLLVIPEKKVAVKTGTSDDKRDNWAIGYTPSYLTLAWVGNNDNSPMHKTLSSGITGATPIWHKITRNLLKNSPYDWYSKPQGVIPREIDPKTGKLACGSKKKRIEYFIVGSEPKDCGKIKKFIVEKVDGQEKIIGEIVDGVEINLPQEGEFEIKLLPLLKDPLMEKTGSKSIIRL